VVGERGAPAKKESDKEGGREKKKTGNQLNKEVTLHDQQCEGTGGTGQRKQSPNISDG